MKTSLLRINYNENVGKQSKNTQRKSRQLNTQVIVNLLAWQKSKARRRVWIVQLLPKLKQ